MKTTLFSSLAVLCLAVPAALATDYELTVIASSLDPELTGTGLASIDDFGRVTFLCHTPQFLTGFCSGDEDEITLLVDNSGPLASFGPLSSNTPTKSPHSIAFLATLDDGGQGAFLFSEGTLKTVALKTSADPESPFLNLGDPKVNDRGHVAFQARLTDGHEGIFLLKRSKLKVLAATGGRFLRFNSHLSVNNHGAVAVQALLAEGEEALLTVNAGRFKILATTSGPFARVAPFGTSINDRGEVAFLAQLDGGGWGIFVADGRSIRSVAFDTRADPSSDFSSLGSQGYTLNSSGQVAFIARVADTGEDGVFTGPNADTDMVIGSFDPLIGSSATFFGVGEILNNQGQVGVGLASALNVSLVIRADLVLE